MHGAETGEEVTAAALRRRDPGHGREGIVDHDVLLRAFR
jgi:hypothetical protein